MTAGGTESILLAVQGARDSRPDVVRPRMVLPATAHAAFHKAAHYFGVEAVLVPVGPDFRADARAMAEAIDDDTVLVVASAPSYAHGVVDPVGEIAAAAAARGVRCHVDACIGGWVLPYAARLGRAVPPWTFAVEGVTSISVDTHKYAYAPKGTSLLLHRDAGLRSPQFFASAAWPGYTMLNATTQSTRSGGRSPEPGRSSSTSGTRATSSSPTARSRRSTRSWPASTPSPRCGSWCRPTRRSSRSRPTPRATPSR
ncbi:aminotransferase class V-fold PLP-dependent enzyme [Nocardioides eburneiflavus]|uniref:aminotransferase class V-fold PLP-dependent enzyme n=1 Tax=Nocardioides eburneiflavus TaxID=2518372 RepID=UPI001FE3B1E6|nr:aminotransferase class V-fold PLP-dependent enzyme [Nocardioides eburneiflavus]